MSFLSYVLPRTILRTTSPYNRDIRIVEEHGELKLLVNGSRQSGEYIKKLWTQAFAHFSIVASPTIKKILVLGVGGGTVIKTLRAMYPKAAITGVDIDPKMVEIAKKYFHIQGCRLVVSDAREFIRRPGKWDLIVVDLFIGATIPSFVGEDGFLQNVANRLGTGGILVINFLQEFEYGNLSAFLRDKLQAQFSKVQDFPIAYNRFFCVIK